MTPALHHRPRQPLPWQWRYPVPTAGGSMYGDDMEFSRDAEDRRSTYAAGFRDRDRAVEYGRRRGWHDMTDAALLGP